ncbi:hypothetical protein D9M69_725560 [compost metagenome]
MNNSNDRQWLQYIETLRQASRPVKIDTLLQQRMNAFVKARKVNMNRVKNELSGR